MLNVQSENYRYIYIYIYTNINLHLTSLISLLNITLHNLIYCQPELLYLEAYFTPEEDSSDVDFAGRGNRSFMDTVLNNEEEDNNTNDNASFTLRKLEIQQANRYNIGGTSTSSIYSPSWAKYGAAFTEDDRQVVVEAYAKTPIEGYRIRLAGSHSVAFQGKDCLFKISSDRMPVATQVIIEMVRKLNP